jgi:hypothetical protein
MVILTMANAMTNVGFEGGERKWHRQVTSSMRARHRRSSPSGIRRCGGVTPPPTSPDGPAPDGP